MDSPPTLVTPLLFNDSMNNESKWPVPPTISGNDDMALNTLLSSG